jgi:hypothetical protein
MSNFHGRVVSTSRYVKFSTLLATFCVKKYLIFALALNLYIFFELTAENLRVLERISLEMSLTYSNFACFVSPKLARLTLRLPAVASFCENICNLAWYSLFAGGRSES